jgi:hypothetical protein
MTSIGETTISRIELTEVLCPRAERALSVPRTAQRRSLALFAPPTAFEPRPVLSKYTGARNYRRIMEIYAGALKRPSTCASFSSQKRVANK